MQPRHLLFSVIFITLLVNVSDYADAATLARESFPFDTNDPEGAISTLNPLGFYQVRSGFDANSATSGPNSNNSGRIYENSTNAQNPVSSATSLGFGAAWTGQSTSLTKATVGPETGGLSFPGQPSSGAALQFDWTSALARHHSRSLASAPVISAGDEYWMSVLVHATAEYTGATQISVAGFAENPNADVDGTPIDAGGGWKVGFAGDGSNMDLVFRHATSSGMENLEILDSAAEDTTYLVFIHGTAGAGGADDDQIEIWINPADLSSEPALGPADVVLSDESLNLMAFQHLIINGVFTTAQQGVVFDEFFLGETFLDVAPNAMLILIPEPVSVAIWSLLGLALTGFGCLRIRRQK